MEREATGHFAVTLTPDGPGDGPIQTLTLDKQFHGDLEAHSHGRMLAFRSDVAGSAGYVAMERVTGRLAGRDGAFTLQHSGTMQRGTPALTVSVVPDSATGALTGLTGTMTITPTSGRHDYHFRYSLPTTSADPPGVGRT